MLTSSSMHPGCDSWHQADSRRQGMHAKSPPATLTISMDKGTINEVGGTRLAAHGGCLHSARLSQEQPNQMQGNR